RDLDEAVAVTLDERRKARVHLSVDLSNTDATKWARMWGSLLGATLFLPLTEVLVEATDGIAVSAGANGEGGRRFSSNMPDASSWRRSVLLPHQFTRDVAALLEPKGSAIFMLLRTSNVSNTLSQLRNYGDTIVHTALTQEQDNKMFALLAH